jgi:hypothetical protein
MARVPTRHKLQAPIVLHYLSFYEPINEDAQFILYIGFLLNLSLTPLHFGERLFKILIINSIACYESPSPFWGGSRREGFNRTKAKDLYTNTFPFSTTS